MTGGHHRRSLITVVTTTEQQMIDQLTHKLVGAHPDIAPDQIARTISEEYGRFDGRPIRDFIPLFVERNAASRLSQLVAQT